MGDVTEDHVHVLYSLLSITLLIFKGLQELEHIPANIEMRWIFIKDWT